jgi:calcyclin binding protein
MQQPQCSWEEALLCTERVTAYGWDQSGKFVSIYVDVAAADDSAPASFETSAYFDEKRCAIILQVEGGVKKCLAIPNLCQAIVPAKSKIKVKPARFVVKLKKEVQGETWSDLTDALDLKEAARKKRIGSSLKDASTQELLADMYANASDEDRKGLMEAAMVGQKKREAEQVTEK